MLTLVNNASRISAICTGAAPIATAISFVSNSYYAFPFIATTYLNQQACTIAVSACSKNYQDCMSHLDGGGQGVTIVVTGAGGMTLAPSVASLGTSATYICSSLSSVACYDLEPSECPKISSASRNVIWPFVASSSVIFVMAHIVF